MIRHFRIAFLVIAAFGVSAAPLLAQQGGAPGRQLPTGSPFGGGVPQGTATAETLQLTVGDVMTLVWLGSLNLNAGYWDIFWPQLLQGTGMECRGQHHRDHTQRERRTHG